MEPLSVVETGDTIDITILHSFPDIYSEAFFSIFGWNVSVTYTEEQSQNLTLTASGEDTNVILENISSPTEPDTQTGFLNALFGHEKSSNGYSVFPLGKQDTVTETPIPQPSPSKDKKSMIATLRNYASSFLMTPSSTYGTIETIQIRIPKHGSKFHIQHENTNAICLEQFFKVGLPSIYCFTGTSLTFEDIIDLKSDMQQQLKYMEKKGYSVSWLNVKRIYKIHGRYVLLSNKEEIKKQEQMNENRVISDVDSLVQRLLDDFISNEEKSSI